MGKEMGKARFEAVFWDFDGTLAYSHRLWPRAALEALLKLAPDYPIDLEQLRPLMRDFYPWDLPEGQYRPIRGAAWWAFMEPRFAAAYQRGGVEAGLARRAAQGIRGQILRLENYCLFEDSVQALKRCRRQGIRNILLSNNYPELPEIVKGLGLARYFSGMAVSGLLGWDKPRPQIFRYAQGLAGPGARCLMVGDNPQADIGGAQAAGLPAALVHRPCPPECRPDYRAETLAGLLEQVLGPEAG